MTQQLLVGGVFRWSLESQQPADSIKRENERHAQSVISWISRCAPWWRVGGGCGENVVLDSIPSSSFLFSSLLKFFLLPSPIQTLYPLFSPSLISSPLILLALLSLWFLLKMYLLIQFFLICSLSSSFPIPSPILSFHSSLFSPPAPEKHYLFLFLVLLLRPSRLFSPSFVTTLLRTIDRV